MEKRGTEGRLGWRRKVQGRETEAGIQGCWDVAGLQLKGTVLEWEGARGESFEEIRER